MTAMMWGSFGGRLRLGSFSNVLGSSWDDVGSLLAVCGSYETHLRVIRRVVLGSSWFGLVLGSWEGGTWGHAGPTYYMYYMFMNLFFIFFCVECFVCPWPQLAPTWPELEQNLAPLGPPWPQLGPTWPNLAQLGPNLAQLGPDLAFSTFSHHVGGLECWKSVTLHHLLRFWNSSPGFRGFCGISANGVSSCRSDSPNHTQES